jgi:hypothetical protein
MRRIWPVFENNLFRNPSLEAGRPRGQPVRAALQVRGLENARLVGQHLAFRVGLQVKHLDIRVDYDGA